VKVVVSLFGAPVSFFDFFDIHGEENSMIEKGGNKKSVYGSLHLLLGKTDIIISISYTRQSSKYCRIFSKI